MPGLPRVRDRMSFGRRVRQAGGSRTRPDRAELPAAVFLAARAGLGVPPPASLPEPDRHRRAHIANLPALGNAIAGTGNWNSSSSRTRTARAAAGADRSQFLL